MLLSRLCTRSQRGRIDLASTSVFRDLILLVLLRCYLKYNRVPLYGLLLYWLTRQQRFFKCFSTKLSKVWICGLGVRGVLTPEDAAREIKVVGIGG